MVEWRGHWARHREDSLSNPGWKTDLFRLLLSHEVADSESSPSDETEKKQNKQVLCARGVSTLKIGSFNLIFTDPLQT